MRFSVRSSVLASLLASPTLLACGSVSESNNLPGTGGQIGTGQGAAGDGHGNSTGTGGEVSTAGGTTAEAGGATTGGATVGTGGVGGGSAGTGGSSTGGQAAGTAGAAGGGALPPATWTTAIDKGLQWLGTMKQANGLYDSQAEMPNEDVAYTYDEAVASLAFLAVGQPDAAAGILTALQGLQNSNGSWANAYSSKSAVVDKEADLGPTAWVVLAAAAYHTQTGSTAYDATAKRALTWALTLQQSNGGILGGLDAKGKQLPYESTEENEDIYPALGFFGMTAQGDKVRTLLTTTVWDATGKLWNAGWSGGVVDMTRYSDVNSWGVMALLDAAPTGYLQALDYNMHNLRLTKTATNVAIDGFAFCAKKDDVWLEGTGQMADALYSAGRAADGDYFTGQIQKFQKADGGIPYSMSGGSTCDDPPDDKMSKDEAVSAVGWFILAATHVNPFHYVKR